MRDGEAERMTDPARSGPTRRVPFGRVVHSFLELLYDSVQDEQGIQARPTPARPLVSWVDDGGSMPILDGRMRGIWSIRERDFLLGRVRSWPDSTVAASYQRASRHPPIGSRCCRSCRSQTPRAGTVMTAQIEAVDFFAFDNSYARLPDRLRGFRPLLWQRPVRFG